MENTRTGLKWGGGALTLTSLVALAALKRFAPAQAFGRWSKPLGLTGVAGGIAMTAGFALPPIRQPAQGPVTTRPADKTVRLISLSKDKAVFQVGEATITLKQHIEAHYHGDLGVAPLFDPPPRDGEPGANWAKACEEVYFELLQKGEPVRGEDPCIEDPGHFKKALKHPEVWTSGLVGAIWRTIEANPKAKIRLETWMGIEGPFVHALLEQVEAEEVDWTPNENYLAPVQLYGPPPPDGATATLERIRDPSGHPLTCEVGDYWVQIEGRDLPFRWVPSTLFDHPYVLIDRVKTRINPSADDLAGCQQVAAENPGFFSAGTTWTQLEDDEEKELTDFMMGEGSAWTMLGGSEDLLKAMAAMSHQPVPFRQRLAVPENIEGDLVVAANATEVRLGWLGEGQRTQLARYTLPANQQITSVQLVNNQLNFTLASKE